MRMHFKHLIHLCIILNDKTWRTCYWGLLVKQDTKEKKFQKYFQKPYLCVLKVDPCVHKQWLVKLFREIFSQKFGAKLISYCWEKALHSNLLRKAILNSFTKYKQVSKNIYIKIAIKAFLGKKREFYQNCFEF